MQKTSKKAIGLILVIVLCFSMIPMPAMAADEMPVPSTTVQNADEPNNEAPASVDVDCEYIKVVDKPLVQVVYHYYDEAQSQVVTDFDDYAVTSIHSYYALATMRDASISIEANKYPAQVPVSTDVLRFRVLLNGSEDITAQAAYDAKTGWVSLPLAFMDQEITVVWYCPTLEVTQLPVTVRVSAYANGTFTNSTIDLTLPSDTNTISVPLAESNRLMVSQNGIDLDKSAYSMRDGNLNVSASALGGNISVTAYTTVMRELSGEMSTMSAPSQVVHTRSSNQIYYGYYTSYYTANGNTAFCLDPTVSGLSAGNYDISEYLTRGTGYDNLIKAAWYLYGGPGYDSVKNNLFDDPDSMTAYGLCHAAAAYMWMDDPSAFTGLSSATRAHLLRVIDSVNAQAMPPEGFSVFLYNVGSTTNQSLMSWEYTPTGNLEIVKTSGDPEKTNENSCYSLAGAVFGVYNMSNEKIGSITTDADGKGRLEGITAGQTGLYILEETSPAGYATSDNKISFEIASGETTTLEVKNNPQGDPVTILLKKQDAEIPTPQGGASLVGAQFEIRYYKGDYTQNELNGKTPARTWIVETDADGFAMLHSDFLVAGSDPLYYASNGTTPTLPLGTVTIQEVKAPAGYLINNELYIRYSRTSGIREAVNTYNAPIVPDTVIRGGIQIQKWDIERDASSLKQGDASLAGAVLDIYNRNGNNVFVGGKTYSPNAAVHSMTTDRTGTAITAADLLPYGQWEIVERTAPTGYLNTGMIRQTFQISKNGEIVKLTTSDKVFKNDLIRGGVRILKYDNEVDENKAQGSATLAGAVFEIVNRSADVVLVQGKLYGVGEVVYTMTTDATGEAATPNDLLSYGTFECREVSPPEGYLATGVLSRTFSIREHGKIVELDASETAIKNNPIRGDLKGIKISDGDGKRLVGVPFSITSVTTGESHTILTDKNGEFSTASAWNPHSQNTNRGETDRDGVWFGEMSTLDDKNGALLYDTYVLEEQPCEANAGRELLSFEVAVYRHLSVVDLGTVTNDYTQMPEIFTTARDQESTTDDAHVSEKTTILDVVYYSGLVVDRDYTVKGVLMDKETNSPLLVDGQEVTAEKTFKALSESGNLTLEFTFNSTALAGKSVVVFETLLLDGKEVAAHADLEDEGQTVTFKTPKIGTTATAEDGSKIVPVSESAKIIDTVSYENLVVGEKYTIKGILMDKESGVPVLIDGKKVIAEETFVEKKAAGSIEVVFTFNSTKLQDRILVVFESLEYEGKEIANHADINDEAQTVGIGVEVLTDESTGTGAKTGRDGLPIWLLVIAIGTVATATLLVARKKKNTDQSK